MEDALTVLEGAQDWLRRYLWGKLDPVEAETAFSEDLLFRMVAVLEKGAPAWLETELRDAPDPERAAAVLRCVAGPLRHRLKR